MEPDNAIKIMRLWRLQRFAGWNSPVAVLMLMLLSACAGSSIQPEFQETADSKPSIMEKAVAIVSPKPKQPPLLPHQMDLQTARRQYHLQKYDVAEFYLKKTLLQVADEPSALKILPWTYFFQKQYDKALLAFQRNHSIDSRDPDSLTGMAWCYLVLQNFPQALDTFARAEKRSPGFYETQKGMAIIYLNQKNHEKALPFLQKIYHSQEIEALLQFWDAPKPAKPRKFLAAFSESPGEPSLFALPVEHPRYRSMLWTLDQAGEPALEEAWRLYRRKLYARALQAFQNLPESIAPSLDAQNGLAWSYLMNKQIRNAERVFKGISQTYPRFIGVVRGIQEAENLKMQKAAFAQYYFDLEKVRIAGKKFFALTREYPDWAYPYAQLGLLELKNGHLESAAGYIHKSLELDPDNEAGTRGLEQLRKIREPELYEADQAFKAADYKTAASRYFFYIDNLKHEGPITESLASAYRGLGWSLFQKGQHSLAIEKFKRAWKHVDFRTDALKGIGFSNFHLKNDRNAIMYLKMAHEAAPEDEEISRYLDRSIMRSWKLDRARRYFDRELKQHPRRATLYIGMGWVHFKANKPDLAVEFFLKSISLDPDSLITEEFFTILQDQRFGWQVFNRLGWAYYHKGNFAESKKLFQISLRQAPDNSEAVKGIGYNFFQTKNYPSAILNLQKTLALNARPGPVTETTLKMSGKISFKTQTTVRSKLARAYYQSGNLKEALRYYQEGLTVHPDQHDAYDGLGWVYLRLNRLTESRAAFSKAVQLEPLNTLSHRGLRKVKQLLATGNVRIQKPPIQDGSTTAPPIEG